MMEFCELRTNELSLEQIVIDFVTIFIKSTCQNDSVMKLFIEIEKKLMGQSLLVTSTNILGSTIFGNFYGINKNLMLTGRS